MSLKKLQTICQKKYKKDYALAKKRFYKTGKGEYGEGDDFLGITVPDSRKLAKDFSHLSHDEIKSLLKSKFHEERFIALMILQTQYLKAVKSKETKLQEKIYRIYFSHRKYVNNWDLVDATAPYLSGHYYFENDQIDVLKLVKAKSLWDRRIAVISMFYFIRQKDFQLPVEIITQRLYDKEDLMHKACGWMLREIGNRDQKALLRILDLHAHQMPRTALRYSIEKLSKDQKAFYMSQKNKKQP